jgi:hypothetical protein
VTSSGKKTHDIVDAADFRGFDGGEGSGPLPTIGWLAADGTFNIGGVIAAIAEQNGVFTDSSGDHEFVTAVATNGARVGLYGEGF